MYEKQIEKKLREEGFSNVFLWRDAPNAFYPDHTHRSITAHIVLEGEITVTSEGVTRTYKAGDRFDIPKGTVHSAMVGPRGCLYVIGER
jgi:quercetin dioxygenase-like cupin family protein